MYKEFKKLIKSTDRGPSHKLMNSVFGDIVGKDDEKSVYRDILRNHLKNPKPRKKSNTPLLDVAIESYRG